MDNIFIKIIIKYAENELFFIDIRYTHTAHVYQYLK